MVCLSVTVEHRKERPWPIIDPKRRKKKVFGDYSKIINKYSDVTLHKSGLQAYGVGKSEEIFSRSKNKNSYR